MEQKAFERTKLNSIISLHDSNTRPSGGSIEREQKFPVCVQNALIDFANFKVNFVFKTHERCSI